MIYQGECCPACNSHPSHLMNLMIEERDCPICHQETKQIAPYRQPEE